MKNHYIRPDQNKHYIALWQRSVSGDKEAFCELVEAHYQVLFNYGTNFTSNRELIKDTLQDLFIHLWEKKETFQIQHLTIYLLRSVRNNLYLSFRESKTTIVSIDANLHDRSDDFTIETALIFEEVVSEKKDKVIEAISNLPKRQKEAVFLKFYQGLDNEQIAELMDVNRQSVANLLHKAILNLRISFDQYHYFLIAIFLI